MPRSTGRGLLEDPYTQWWDGYGTHDTVILDDFRGDCMRLTDLQRLLDWYPLWVEIKGGSLPMLATRYVITSNQHPADWYTRGDPMGRSSGASGTSPRPMGGSWSSLEQGPVIESPPPFDGWLPID